MNKREIFEILMESGSEKIKDLSVELMEKIPYQTVRKPEEGLLMFRMRESVENTAFNVGEVLVVQAEVRINNSLGYAMIIGMDKKSALNRAFLMGIIESGLPESEEILKLAALLKEEKLEALREEREIINSTRVKFETMGGQDPNVSHNKNDIES